MERIRFNRLRGLTRKAPENRIAFADSEDLTSQTARQTECVTHFKALVMSSILIFAFIGYSLYMAFRKQRPAQSSKPPVSRSHASGDVGEARVCTELDRVLSWLCGDDYYVHPTALLLNHAPGTDFATAEVDHLVIAPFGIFVVETKHWAARIAPGSDATTLLCHLPGGRLEERRSPLNQNRSKVAFLRSMLPAMWDVHGVGVFSSDVCTLSPALPIDLIRASDLGHWLREKKNRHALSGRPSIKVKLARDAIRHLSVDDPTGAAIEIHRRKIQQSLPI
ncbi:NERD domain-containing protein [Burkholderia vietnamiensis]|nr:NERD domain-containing protein [Burkholderia vietnamiensis]